MSTALPRLVRPQSVEPQADEHRATSALRGVVIDAPDLLYDATLWRRWLFQLLGRLGKSLNYAQFDKDWSAQLVDVHRGRREFSEALQAFLLDEGLTWSQVDEVEAASRIQRERFEANVRPLPGTARVLEALAARHWQLMAWADAPITSQTLAARLERLFPTVRFAACLTSFDLEETLPSPTCYQAMFAALEANPAEVMFVGRHAEHLTGAAAAGAHTTGIDLSAEAVCDHALVRFDDVVGHLEQHLPAVLEKR